MKINRFDLDRPLQKDQTQSFLIFPSSFIIHPS